MTAIAENPISPKMPPKTTVKGKKIVAASSADDVAPKKGRGGPKRISGKKNEKKRKESYAIYIYKVDRFLCLV
jgi:hypothetical protein